MLKKLKKLLNPLCNTKGISNQLTALFFVIVACCSIAFFISISGTLHDIGQLNSFAREMTYTAARLGMCQSQELDERFEELKEVTGLNPQITFEADFLNGNNKRVQYGKKITVKLTYKTNLIAFGNFSAPITLRAKATEESKEYFKNV